MKQKAYETIPFEKRLEMETWLHGYLKEISPELRQRIHADREGWFAEYHFDWGMHVRNALRRAGFGEKFLGVENLDDIYVEAVEHAILVNSAGEIMVPVVVTGRTVKPFWTRVKIFVLVLVIIAALKIVLNVLSKMLDASG